MIFVNEAVSNFKQHISTANLQLTIILKQMKPLSKHKFKIPYHGEVVTPVSDRIPAYNSSGLKTFTRILPPLRNKARIDIPKLYTTLRQIMPQVPIECAINGIIIDDIEITIISEGLASFKKVKFRFRDIKDLLTNLIQAKILPDDIDILRIRDLYMNYE